MFLNSLKIVKVKANATIEEALESLLELCDEDFSGRNGEEYTSQKALEQGFDSDARYWLHRYWERKLSIASAIDLVLQQQYVSNSDYYTDYQIEYTQVNDIFVISTCSMHR